jgi:hypothetical protein
LFLASEQEVEDSKARGIHSGKPFLRVRTLGPEDIVLDMNRDKIRSVGLPAVADLLVKLQVYRATADVKRGTELFNKVILLYKRFYSLWESKGCKQWLVYTIQRLEKDKLDGVKSPLLEDFIFDSRF